VALGTVVLSEPISARTLLASAVIVLAVAMIVTARGRAARPAPTADASHSDGVTGAVASSRAGS
jgi:drug/metabolite transporter (DMT)-like permease